MSVPTIQNLIMINQPWLRKMPAKSAKAAQKSKFCTENRHLSEPLYSLKMRLLVENKLFLVSFTTSFTITIWQRGKLGSPKEGNLKLILDTFGHFCLPGRSSKDKDKI